MGSSGKPKLTSTNILTVIKSVKLTQMTVYVGKCTRNYLRFRVAVVIDTARLRRGTVIVILAGMVVIIHLLAVAFIIRHLQVIGYFDLFVLLSS